jgi:hypothetical protein
MAIAPGDFSRLAVAVLEGVGGWGFVVAVILVMLVMAVKPGVAL